MQRWIWALALHLSSVSACVSSERGGSGTSLQAKAGRGGSDAASANDGNPAPARPSSRIFSRYLNHPIDVSDENMTHLELEEGRLGACASEYAPLLRLGLDGFIDRIEAEKAVPFSLKCQPLPVRQDLQVCDFPPIPAMPLSSDCRNQLAMLRIRLVMQLELDTPLESLSPVLTAHRVIAEVMSGDADPTNALQLSNHLVELEADDLDAHSIRVLLIFLTRQMDMQKAAFDASMQKLEHSQRQVSRSFAHLMEFNVAHLAIIQARTAARNARLQKAAVQLAELSPHPLAGREASAVAAFYRGDRSEAIRIMREVVTLPLADESTQDSLRKLEQGSPQPFKIRMFYSFQF